MESRASSAAATAAAAAAAAAAAGEPGQRTTAGKFEVKVVLSCCHFSLPVVSHS